MTWAKANQHRGLEAKRWLDLLMSGIAPALIGVAVAGPRGGAAMGRLGDEAVVRCAQTPYRRVRLDPLGPRPTQEQPRRTASLRHECYLLPAITDELRCADGHGDAVPCGALGILPQQ